MKDIPILMLHSVNDKHKSNPMGPLSLYSRELKGMLRALKVQGYRMISMSDLLAQRYDPEEKFIVLTFDYGFKDNLYCAEEILERFDARATIFVNPGFMSQSEKDSVWGFMSAEELVAAEKSGIFDIQAHGMTHEFIFKSDKIIDFFTKEKFQKYYWLAWMLFPGSANAWDDSAYDYAEKIPEGYPVFEYDRRLSCSKFIPDAAFVDRAISLYRACGNKAELMETLNRETCCKGRFETKSEYLEEAKYQLSGCKMVLENLLNKRIEVICFPGGGYNPEILQIARDAGYRCFMNASRERKGNNFDHLQRILKGEFTGLNRFSVSHFEKGILSSSFSAFLIMTVSLGSYQKNRFMKSVKSMLGVVKKRLA